MTARNKKGMHGTADQRLMKEIATCWEWLSIKKYCGSNIYVHFVFMKLYRIDEIRCSFLLVSLNWVYRSRCGCWGCFIFLTMLKSYIIIYILHIIIRKWKSFCSGHQHWGTNNIFSVLPACNVWSRMKHRLCLMH